MKEIAKIFYQMFEHDDRVNDKFNFKSAFKVAWRNLLFRTFVCLALVLLLCLFSTLSSAVNNWMMLGAAVFIFGLTSTGLTFAIWVAAEEVSSYELKKKVQKEFLPKLTDEQVLLLIKEKASKVLNGNKDWDNLNYLQEVGREKLCKSLTYNNIFKTIKNYTLKEVKGVVNE